jgi:hypothetical protein
MFGERRVGLWSINFYYAKLAATTISPRHNTNA